MDQRLALWWVHTNAAAFGSSAGRVMVFGQSAGAVSLCMHAANPSSLPPIAGLAIESGMCDSAAWLSRPDDTIAFTASLLNSTHCGNLSAVGSEGRRVLACVRSLPLATILNLLIMHPSFHLPQPPASAALPPLLPIMGFAPTLDSSADGVVLSPVAAAVAGSAMRVPYIIGTNQDEGSLFVPTPPPKKKITTESAFCAVTAEQVLGLPLLVHGAKLPPSDSDVVLALKTFFPHNTSSIPAIISMYHDQGSNSKAIAAIIRDMMFTCPQRRLSRALAASGYSVNSYRFLPQLHTLIGSNFGDYHCSELPFIFAKTDAAGRGSDDLAAAASIEKLMGAAWASLADGRAPAAAQWPRFGSDSSFPSLLIDGGSNNRTVEDLGADVCALWDTIPF
jgi:para-nitrobenzyl esterase